MFKFLIIEFIFRFLLSFHIIIVLLLLLLSLKRILILKVNIIFIDDNLKLNANFPFLVGFYGLLLLLF